MTVFYDEIQQKNETYHATAKYEEHDESLVLELPKRPRDLLQWFSAVGKTNFLSHIVENGKSENLYKLPFTITARFNAYENNNYWFETKVQIPDTDTEVVALKVEFEEKVAALKAGFEKEIATQKAALITEFKKFLSVNNPKQEIYANAEMLGESAVETFTKLYNKAEDVKPNNIYSGKKSNESMRGVFY